MGLFTLQIGRKKEIKKEIGNGQKEKETECENETGVRRQDGGGEEGKEA